MHIERTWMLAIRVGGMIGVLDTLPPQHIMYSC